MDSGESSENASPDRGRKDSRGWSYDDSLLRREDINTPIPAISSEPPVGSALLPYIDAFLQNVHPVGCNNFFHPGVLGEALEKAPRVLVLGLCGVTAKFTKARHAQEQGRFWIEEARDLIIRSLDNISTLNISVLQFLATHDMQDGRFTSARNLIGKSIVILQSLIEIS